MLAAENLSSDHSANIGLDLLGDLVRIQAGDGCSRPADMDNDCVASNAQPTRDLDDAVDLFQRTDDLRGARFQLLRIVTEQLDFNGLRDGRQVANQIFHQLSSFDLQTRNIVLNLSPNLGHDIFDIAPSPG